LTGQVAAISCGVYQGIPVLDLDYDEDSAAEIDSNFVMTADDQLVEVQATGEAHPFSRSTFNQMLDLASAGCGEIFKLQQQAVRDAL
jgi:ribonuclease PH